MSTLYQKILLANGMTVFIDDHTRHYYGGFYMVKLDVVCSVPVPDEVLLVAGNLLEKSVTYRRSLEQMGVPATDVERVKESLLSHFTIHSLSYLAAQNFPVNFVASELTKARKRLGQQYVGHFQ